MGTLNANREFSSYADDVAKRELNVFLASIHSPTEYRDSMTKLGLELGSIVSRRIQRGHNCLVVATAEDADYLAKGVIDSLRCKHETLAAVFWNNHYSVGDGSVAPVIHRYLQPGFEEAEYLVVVKSIISTSCVVKTNILALIEKTRAKKIFIVAPVIYVTAEESLRSEFPRTISDLFEFVYFAKDDCREPTGEVRPGIGGQVYQLLGVGDHPSRTGYFPQLVRGLMSL